MGNNWHGHSDLRMRTAKQVMMTDAFTYTMHRMKKLIEEQLEETGIAPGSMDESSRCLSKAFIHFSNYMKNPMRYRKK